MGILKLLIDPTRSTKIKYLTNFKIISSRGTLKRVIVNTNAAPAAIGPYNQAVMVDNTMYISGCIGFIPETMEIIGGGVEAEASQALINMGAILKAAGCTHKNVVKTTVLLNDIKDFAAVNEIYKKFFTSHYPARAAYQ